MERTGGESLSSLFRGHSAQHDFRARSKRLRVLIVAFCVAMVFSLEAGLCAVVRRRRRRALSQTAWLASRTDTFRRCGRGLHTIHIMPKALLRLLLFAGSLCSTLATNPPVPLPPRPAKIPSYVLQHAPILRLASEEAHFPTDPVAFLQNVRAQTKYEIISGQPDFLDTEVLSDLRWNRENVYLTTTVRVRAWSGHTTSAHVSLSGGRHTTEPAVMAALQRRQARRLHRQIRCAHDHRTRRQDTHP